ncbi:MAG: MotA/TolQ/ExbB proton channel family protein [Planctomycetes bacterium]|nr:MotA/TolQ/ExbB proton channel family protein [Planctomycetota bacterium]
MIELIRQGSWFMVPLGLCSIVGLAVILDRWFYLRNAQRELALLAGKIDGLVDRGDIDGVREFCNENPGLLAGIFLAGIKKYKQLKTEPNLDFIQHEINKGMEDASIINAVDLERRLPLLASVGNVAPLFGFAGTVTGMISAFAEIAAAANPDAQTVARGIQEALVTTASGLIIAIPAVLAFNYFSSRIDALNARTEESANGLIDMMVMTLVEQRSKANGAHRESR